MKFIKFCFVIFVLFYSLIAFSAQNAEKVSKKIRLAGPAAVVSYPLMVMTHQQQLENFGIELEFVRWKNPDQLRAMVIGEQVDFSAMPSNLAATFYNRGHKLSLINISVWNIMSIVSRASKINKTDSLGELVGQEIVVPFKNDMPSIVLKQLLKAQLAERAKQVVIRPSHNLASAAQVLLAGQVDHALLIEPLTSIVLFQNKQQGKSDLVASVNISEQWQKTFPQSPKLPQAGIIANITVNENLELVKKVRQAYKSSALWCQKNLSACADLVRNFLPKMPKQALITAIDNTGLRAIDAKDAQGDLESFYRLLESTAPERIGGKLPHDGFYK